MIKASGGLNPDSRRAKEHAERMYEAIRKRSTDYLNISKNTGFSIEQVQIIKNYLFNSRHYLGSTMTERFYPSYEIAESWKRLSYKDARFIQEHDVLLLYHELYEINLLVNNPKMEVIPREDGLNNYIRGDMLSLSQKADSMKSCRKDLKPLNDLFFRIVTGQFD